MSLLQRSRPSALALCLLALAACRSSIENRNPVGEPFPATTGASLEEKPVALPGDYAGRPVVLLEEPEAVAGFLGNGGRVIVLPAARLDELTQIAPVVVRARARRGERTLLVVTAEPPEP